MREVDCRRALATRAATAGENFDALMPRLTTSKRAGAELTGWGEGSVRAVETGDRPEPGGAEEQPTEVRAED